MALDHAQLERLLCERLCADVRVHRRHDDVLMLESPFTFPDGDHYPVYLSETPGGGVKLSDRGHTLMHISYDHDVDSFYEGARASLREQTGHFVLGHADFVGGLEFNCVVIVGVDKGRVPQESGDLGANSKNFFSYAAHNRLYVAASRARFALQLLGLKSRGASDLLTGAANNGLIEGIERRRRRSAS